MTDSLLPLDTDHRSYEADGDVVPLADLEEPGLTGNETQPRSEEFILAETMIKEGIANATEDGTPNIEIEVWVKDPEGGHYAHISLGQFFGGNQLRGIVDKDEYDILFNQYGSLARTEPKDDVVSEPDVSAVVEQPSASEEDSQAQETPVPERPKDFREVAFKD